MASMNAILDAVADGISRLVYFYIEAEENVKPIGNIVPGAQALKKALDVVIGIGRKLASDWANDEQAEELNFLTDLLDKNSNQVMKSAEVLGTSNSLDQESKKKMFHSAKNTLKETALLLLRVDEHDVVDIKKWAKMTETSLNEVCEHNNDSVGDFIHYCKSLIKLVETRISILADPKYQRRLENSKKTLDLDHKSLLGKLKDDNKKEITSLQSNIQAALTEIMVVSQISCDNMWAGVDLDLSYLSDRNVNLMDELRACHKELKKELNGTTDLIFSENMRLGEADLKYINIKDIVRRECFIGMAICDKSRDPSQKREIVSCVDALKDISLSTQKQLRKTAKDPSNEEGIENWMEGKSQTVRASKDLLAACSSLYNSLLDASDELFKLLDSLKNTKDPKEAVELAKKATQLLGEEAKLARRNGGPNESLAELLDSQRIPFLKAVKEFLSNPDDPDAKENLDKICDDLKDASAQAVNKAGLPAEVQLLGLARDLPPELEDLMNKLDNDLARSLGIAIADKLDEASQLAEEIAGSSMDPAKRAELEKKAIELQTPAGLLRENSHPRKKLDQSVKPALMDSVKSLSDLFDFLLDDNVDICKEIDKVLDELKDDSFDDDPEPLLPLKKAIEKAIAFANASTPPGCDPALKKKLLDASKNLVDGLGSLFDSLQKYRQDPNNPKNKENLKDGLEGLKKKAIEFEDAKAKINIKDVDPIILPDILDNLEDLIKNENSPIEDKLRAANHLPSAIILATKPVIDNVIPQIQDPIQRTNVMSQCEKLKEKGNELVPLIKTHCQNPGDNQIKKDLIKNISEVRKISNDLEDSSCSNPLDLGTKLVGLVAEASQALKEGDNAKTMDAIKASNATAEKLNKLLAKLAANTTDPKHKKALLDAAKGVANALSLLNKAFTDLLKNPKDPNALKALDQATSMLHNHLDQLLGSGITSEEDLDNLARDLTQQLEDLKKNPKITAKDLIPILTKQKILAQAKATLASDPARKKQLLDAAKKIGLALSKLSSSLPVKDLQKTVEDAIQNNHTLLGKDFNDEIIMAAESVTQSLRRKKADPNTPTGKMFVISTELVKYMEALSVAAKSKNIKDMIMTTRKITQEMKAFSKAANEVAQNCSDPKMKENLICASQAVGNYSTQLKILTAVKSATGEEDEKAAKNQLVTCAKGLANSVIYCCGAAESANLKSIK